MCRCSTPEENEKYSWVGSIPFDRSFVPIAFGGQSYGPRSRKLSNCAYITTSREHKVHFLLSREEVSVLRTVSYLDPALTLNFLRLSTSFFGGSAYNHTRTKAKNPTTTLHRPAIHGHAPVIAQLRGHSSCAKCRTVTCRFSSMVVKNGRL